MVFYDSYKTVNPRGVKGSYVKYAEKFSSTYVVLGNLPGAH